MHATADGCADIVPVGQTVQAGEAAMLAKVPGGQEKQTADAGGEKVPAGQARLQMNAPDCGWKKPAAHWLHMTVLSNIENVPG